MTVHIVEDDPGVRDALSELCRSVGKKVRTYETCRAFGDGDQVIGSDIVLVDLQMPDAMGTEVVKRIRSQQAPARVVVISACPRSRSSRRCRATRTSR